MMMATAMGLLAGCATAGSTRPQIDDPLLRSKPPVQGARSPTIEPFSVADSEPVAPSVPLDGLATMPRAGFDHASLASDPRHRSRPRVVVTPALRSSDHVASAVPAVRTIDGDSQRAVPASRRIVQGQFGHSEDYTWLQGVLDTHYRGQTYLRYADPRHEDRYGGKVCLEDDPRLAQFEDGDIIEVEGEIAMEDLGARHQGWKHYPRFRIRSATLVQRKN
jgi:hypothetical protein